MAKSKRRIRKIYREPFYRVLNSVVMSRADEITSDSGDLEYIKTYEQGFWGVIFRVVEDDPEYILEKVTDLKELGDCEYVFNEGYREEYDEYEGDALGRVEETIESFLGEGKEREEGRKDYRSLCDGRLVSNNKLDEHLEFKMQKTQQRGW